MNTKRTFIFSMILYFFILHSVASAAGNSGIAIIGFSEDGRYMAYESIFYYDMAATGYKKIMSVYVSDSRFVKTIVVWDENREINDEIQKKNEARMEKQIEQNPGKYHIIKGNRGTRVYQDPAFPDPLNYQ